MTDGIDPLPGERPAHVLERDQDLSRSLLWDLQRRYFAGRGIEAWRSAEVPHYITSNPTVADAYAEVVLAFLRDRERLAPEEGNPAEPLYLCELGSGSGRFAFHFLTRLVRLCERYDVAPERFRYLLTDNAESSLEFWRGHPGLLPFFERGLLDIAPFDVERSSVLALERGGRTLKAGSLTRPLVILANYLFDSVPQDLFVLDAGGCRPGLVSLFLDEDPAGLEPVELLERVRCEITPGADCGESYPEPWLRRLLAGYRGSLEKTHLLFPATGLRCLRRLQALSRSGLVLLTADHGEHRLSGLEGKEAPELLRHGSFSLPVNYHAVKAYCEQSGGLPLFPVGGPSNLIVGCCLLLPAAAAHLETRRAYERQVREFGPSDFYALARLAWRNQDDLSSADLLACLRFGLYDSYLFRRLLPRWLDLASSLGEEERGELRDALDRVWAGYFPLGEDADLARDLAVLLYAMGEPRRALDYFARSIEIYGPDTGTLYNMAACHFLLEAPAPARTLLEELLRHEPEDEPARELLARCGAQ